MNNAYGWLLLRIRRYLPIWLTILPVIGIAIILNIGLSGWDEHHMSCAHCSTSSPVGESSTPPPIPIDAPTPEPTGAGGEATDERTVGTVWEVAPIWHATDDPTPRCIWVDTAGSAPISWGWCVWHDGTWSVVDGITGQVQIARREDDRLMGFGHAPVITVIRTVNGALIRHGDRTVVHMVPMADGSNAAADPLVFGDPEGEARPPPANDPPITPVRTDGVQIGIPPDQWETRGRAIPSPAPEHSIR